MRQTSEERRAMIAKWTQEDEKNVSYYILYTLNFNIE